MDSHIHLQDFKQRCATDIIAQAQQVGVDKLICVAAKENDWQEIAILHQTHPEAIIPAFGLHPWYVEEAKPNWEKRLAGYLEKFPTALVGEIGLDRIKSPSAQPQADFFAKQLELARHYQRPALIHAVKAQEWLEDFWKLLPQKFVFHSYSGPKELLKKIISHGGMIGFNFAILQRLKMEEILKLTPIENILLETDAPYQSPIKGEETSPVALPHLAKEIARLRGDDWATFVQQVYQNSLEFINV